MTARRSALTSSHFGQGVEPDRQPEQQSSDPHLSWLPTAEKRSRDRRWEQTHQAMTFRGVLPSLHTAIKELAEYLQVNVDDVARAFLEYSLRCYELGRLKIEPVLHQKLTLFPEGKRAGWYEAGPGNRAPSSSEKRATPKQKAKPWQFRVSYRLPLEIRLAVDKLRTQKNVPVGEIVSVLLDYALKAYQRGQLVLTPVPKQGSGLLAKGE